MKKTLIEIAGWYGAVAILIAYTLVSLEIVSSSSWIFHTLNLTGALGVMTVALYKKVYQSVVLNVVWAAVAVIALAGLILY